MNIGEASAVTTLVRHLTDGAQPDDYADEVVLAVVDLNAHARKSTRYQAPCSQPSG